MADYISCNEFEKKHAKLFPSDTGNVSKLLRMTSESLIIQTNLLFTICELVEQITENSYLQYFIGTPDLPKETLPNTSMLLLFPKIISAEFLMKITEYLLTHKNNDNNGNTPPSVEKHH